jgi:PqqD family protein of HPr-rel-A system
MSEATHSVQSMSQDHRHDVPSEEMTVPPAYRPRKAADVLELDMGDGLILYNHDSSLVHHLNPSAGVLWHLCDGDASVEQLGREVAEEYGLDAAKISREIGAWVAELDALGLIEDASGVGIVVPDGDPEGGKA